MKVLVIGSKGRMGVRYTTILRHLKEELIGVDVGDDLPDSSRFDRVIIACPTDLHHWHALWAMACGKPVLCEKPIDKDARNIQSLIEKRDEWNGDIRMVSNWSYAVSRAMHRIGEIAVMGEMEVEYNYYDSGKDGFFWDCIQPIYLAGKFKFNRASPVFDCKVNGFPVTLDDFSHSYPHMVSEWLYADSSRLWTLEDALKANEKVEAAMRLCGDAEAGEVNFTGALV